MALQLTLQMADTLSWISSLCHIPPLINLPDYRLRMIPGGIGSHDFQRLAANSMERAWIQTDLFSPMNQTAFFNRLHWHATLIGLLTR
ncbi:hypothetical protein [Delftia sp. DT-2]|uniref:hypothetical protein n=1 Tax=Delftia sp. DT-2 TaxID=3022772 RepID=UPI00233E6A01|nr:hypothetical protein [Delftia sp. DT-2]MDC2862049.1 hypothetical protein [Delftia sp. DT-2]